MRLIDGDELIAKLYQDQPMNWTGSDVEVQELNDYELFRNMVDNAPIVDAVVVIRCKDCRNHRELNRKDRLESGYAEGVVWCMNRSDGVWADGFCSDGEPKEN